MDHQAFFPLKEKITHAAINTVSKKIKNLIIRYHLGLQPEIQWLLNLKVTNALLNASMLIIFNANGFYNFAYYVNGGYIDV